MKTHPQQQKMRWIDKKRQKRKRIIFTRSLVTILLLIALTLLLSVIGLLFTVQGGTILAVVAILATLVAWLFPLAPQPSISQNAVFEKISVLDPGSKVVLPRVPEDYQTIFHFATKLSDYKNLYGRVGERNTLISRTLQKNSTSLVGPRRIGKSWLIEYLHLVAHQELGPDYRIVSIDVTSARCDTVAGFAEYILSILKSEVKDRQDALSVLDLALEMLSKKRLKLQADILIMLERAMQDLSQTGIIPVVCIDEFGGLLDRSETGRYRIRKKEFDLNFFKSLRVMCTSQNSNLVLVIASQEPLRKIVGQAGRTSGFFNIFEQITVRPFNLSEAEEFIEAKGNIALFDDIERDQMLKLGAVGWGPARKYWPIRLELIGKMILQEKALKPESYRPQSASYWKQFKRAMEEIYRGVF